MKKQDKIKSSRKHMKRKQDKIKSSIKCMKRKNQRTGSGAAGTPLTYNPANAREAWHLAKEEQRV